jgi:hypothetical protein
VVARAPTVFPGQPHAIPSQQSEYKSWPEIALISKLFSRGGLDRIYRNILMDGKIDV